jgi:hypothetical protein
MSVETESHRKSSAHPIAAEMNQRNHQMKTPKSGGKEKEIIIKTHLAALTTVPCFITALPPDHSLPKRQRVVKAHHLKIS